MPRSDDSNGFPRGRLRRPHPRPSAPDWGREEGASNDWRYPDPAERYSQGHDAPPARDPFADEWQTGSSQDNFGSDGRHAGGRRQGSWPEPDDPFDWDAPDQTEEAGWRPAPYQGDHHEQAADPFASRDEFSGRGDFSGREDFSRDDFSGSDPWAVQNEPFDTSPRGASQQPATRDDSLFRRIDGSVQEPDLSALTQRVAPDADPFAEDAGRDPSELRDRFFSRTGGIDESFEQDSEPPRANIFDFESHRGQARTTRQDDPYSWDNFDDEPEVPAPEVAAPAHHDPYADAYGEYDPYAEEAHLHDEEDADFLDDEPGVYDEPVQQPKSRRKLMVAGVLVAAVATGGAAAFVYKNMQDGSFASGDAPTLLADDGPVKSAPSDPGGREFPDGNKQIYDRLTGGPSGPVEDTRSSGDDDAGTNAIPGIVTTGAQAPADTLDERIAAALRNSGRPVDESQAAALADPDSPRPVRTLTVRPDGSVVPAEVVSPNTADNLPSQSETVTTAGIVATTGSGASAPSSNTSQQRSDTQASRPEASAPRPEPAQPRPEPTRVASAQPTPTSATQPETASANPFFVQLAARRDQTSALAAFADLQQKYPSILDGLAPTIKRADLGDKGVWYRLWVGPMDTRGNAADVCEKLKQAGLGGCFVRTE